MYSVRGIQAEHALTTTTTDTPSKNRRHRCFPDIFIYDIVAFQTIPCRYRTYHRDLGPPQNGWVRSASYCCEFSTICLVLYHLSILPLLDGYHNFLTDQLISYINTSLYDGGGPFIVYGELSMALCLLSGVMMNEGWCEGWRRGRSSGLLWSLIS